MNKNTCVREFQTNRQDAHGSVEIKGCFALYNDPPAPESSFAPHKVVHSLLDNLDPEASFPYNKFVDFAWDVPIIGDIALLLRGYYWVTDITTAEEPVCVN
jgi:hypothetical protein